SLEAEADADVVGRVLAEAVGEVHGLYPGTQAEPSRLNFVVTDGSVLAASRWAHTLYLLEQRGPGLFRAREGGPPLPAAALAAEPINPGDGWRELPERSVVLVRPDLSWRVDRL